MSLEAGRALQRALDSAPAAKTAVKAGAGDVEGSGLAQAAMQAAADTELSIFAGPVDDALVDRRLEELRRLISMTTPLDNGARVAAGDEVELDLLGYVKGEVFMAHQAEWFEVKPNAFLPGLFESLVNMAPPDNAVLQLRLPAHYPVAELAGQAAAFAVTVRQGRRRTLPDADDPIFIQLTARKVKDLPALRAKLREELEEERARLAVDEAKLALMRQLYIKVGANDDVPDELVDEEVRKRWKVQIGDAMAHQGVALDDQKKSLAHFAQPAVRAEARRTVWEQRCLEAVADANEIALEEGAVPKMIAELAPDIRRSDVDHALYQNATLAKEIARGHRLHKALLLLLGEARITFDATPRPLDRAILPSLPTPGQAGGGSSGGRSGSGGNKPGGDVTAARGLKRR